MAELVASMVVGPLVSMVKDKASSYLLDQYNVMEGMEEQHRILKRKLPAILDVIADAEQAATHREGAKAWLEELKTVAYHANEVFDEFKYEALRRQAKKKGHYKELGFGIVKLFPTHNRFVFRNKMGNKLRRIVQAIEVLVAEMNSLGFKFEQQTSASKQWRQTDSLLVDPENIVSRSRHEEKNKIVEKLIHPAHVANIMVLPIVGIGGLGKTTLAQLIYNDPRVQKYFQAHVWVCVSDDFNVHDLARKICQSSEKDNDKVIKKLQDELNGKRYLLVLDDVWNQNSDKWDKLKACLQPGGAGSAVLVTTRIPATARLMGTVEAHDITLLGCEFIKEIIEKRAFHLQQIKPPELHAMVDEFVKRCAGSPLAAKAIGSVLSTKTSVKEWKDVLNKSSICNEETGILPILKLSYDDLPSEMKQCFSFCAVFPKDYEIDVDKLIQLWIANGFIQEHKQPETIGKRIFGELAARSFFQDVKLVPQPVWEIYFPIGNYWRKTCKIHDLMHNVALSTMEKECAMATDVPRQIQHEATTDEPIQIEWLRDTARHLFLSCKDPETILNDSLIKKSPAIQTLLCDCPMESSLQHLSKYSSLKAVQLYLLRPSFPLIPKHLHHLRYLDLSGSEMRALPEDISILYNLQTLNLCGCRRLDRLPRQMKYMTALRHLYTHRCSDLKSMPQDIRKLTSLQTLTCFIAGTGSDCSNVGEMQNLNLGGLLELRQLQNVTEKDAKTVNLGNKKELREVMLAWTADRKVEYLQNHSEVLECLKPHDGLQAIRIYSYGGTTFPSWTDMLQNMAQIHLCRCEKVQYLFSGCPSFTFPNLKELTLQTLSNLERWWELDGSQEESIMFPELEKLRISDCAKLTGLPGRPTFPKLENVRIVACPELRTRAKSPKLVALHMKGPEEEMLLWIARHRTSLTNLELQALYSETTSLSDHSLRELKEKGNREFPLVDMQLDGLKSSVAELCAYFVQLRELKICTCDALVHWPEKEFESLVSLRELVIWGCDSLIGYAEAPEPSTSERSQVLPRLEILRMFACHNLVEVFNVPASLRIFSIRDCDKVESIFGRQQQGKSASIEAPSTSSVGNHFLLPCLEELLIEKCGSLTSVGNHFLLPCLEVLKIDTCGSLTEVLDLPLSLKTLSVFDCAGLRSLGFHSGELPALKSLWIWNCKTLSSLAMGPQVCPSLKVLRIKGCPGIKKLPTCLQQRLGSLEKKYVDASLEGIPMLLKPMTWKYAISTV